MSKVQAVALQPPVTAGGGRDGGTLLPAECRLGDWRSGHISGHHQDTWGRFQACLLRLKQVF